jgi:hypothetical protein
MDWKRKQAHDKAFEERRKAVILNASLRMQGKSNEQVEVPTVEPLYGYEITDSNGDFAGFCHEDSLEAARKSVENAGMNADDFKYRRRKWNLK